MVLLLSLELISNMFRPHTLQQHLIWGYEQVRFGGSGPSLCGCRIRRTAHHTQYRSTLAREKRSIKELLLLVSHVYLVVLLAKMAQPGPALLCSGDPAASSEKWQSPTPSKLLYRAHGRQRESSWSVELRHCKPLTLVECSHRPCQGCMQLLPLRWI